MKQRQEARNGIDDLIANVPRGHHLALQFKSPRPTPPDGEPFYFNVNARQNNHLHGLASSRPHAVLYVLPHLNTFGTVRLVSPNLLDRTYVARVIDVGWLSPRKHHIETRAPAGGGLRYGWVRSETSRVLIQPVAGALEETLAPTDVLTTDDGPLIRHDALQDWLESMFEAEQGNAFAIGQRLRGFSTVCIPG